MRQNKAEMAEHHTGKDAENKARAEQENLGEFGELFSAKSGIDGQDGGVVTALLILGMKKGLFDAAIVVKRKEGYNVEPAAAKDIDAVMAARGTKYLRVRTTQKLRELIDQGAKKIAVVCTPCEATLARKMQQTLKRDSPEIEVTVIGLFCFEAFNYANLKQETQRILGVDIDKAQKTQIHKGKFTVHLAGKEYSCKVKDLDQAVEKGCRFCGDFSAQLADISVGSAGSQSGYSTVIVRTDVGKRLLEDLDASRAGADKEEIVKLSKLKRERAQKNVSAYTIDTKNPH
jgi:coenzyme F420-reducing hydrogenase beta subunit